jgi:integrase
MPHYLCRRNGGGYFYQRRVPKDLRHCRDVFKNQFIEVYLGTSDRTTAKRKVSEINERWERTFEAMRRNEAVTAEQIERIKLAAQLKAYKAMVADPIDGPGQIADDIERFLPNVEEDTTRYLERAGLDPNDDANKNAAMRAILIGTMNAQVFFEKGVEPPPVPAYDPLVLDSPLDGPTILEAAEAYEKATDVATSEKTRLQLKASARLFADHVGKDKPVAAITGRDAVAFLDRLATISPDYRRDAKSAELTLAQLEEAYRAVDGEGLSAATLNRHAMNMRVLINWLIRRHEVPEEHRNPFDRKSRKVKTNGFEPMTDSEIAALLKDAPMVRSFGRNFQECIGWLVALGAYTGARAGELCALTKDDVHKKDGVHFVAIREGKTKAAARVIPVHPELVKAGFLEYVKTCQGPLFGITAKYLAKRFPDYRRKHDVDRPGVTFHSLRKSFVTSLEEAEVPSDTVALLVGHKSGRSFSFSVYSPHGPTLKKLSEAVANVHYKAVKLPRKQ